MEKEYAQALFNLSQKPGAGASELVNQLVVHLKKTGRMRLLPHISRELGRIEARAKTFDERLEVASEQEKAQAEHEAKEFGIHAKAQVNGNLVSGWRARSGSRVIDRSGKRALIDLYRQITSA